MEASWQGALAHAEDLVARAGEAAAAGNFAAAAELDRELAAVLGASALALDALDGAARRTAAERLRALHAAHDAVLENLRLARDGIRAELLDIAKGRRGVSSYLESAAG